MSKKNGTLSQPHSDAAASLVTVGAVVVVAVIIACATLHRSQLLADARSGNVLADLKLDGGWRSDVELNTLLETGADGERYPTPCTIPRVPWTDAWAEDWPPPRTPVLFTNYSNGWLAGERWTKRGLREEPYSVVDVQASTPAGSLLEQKGKPHIKQADISLRSFIDRMEEDPGLPWYVFERRKALQDVLLADIEIPRQFGGPKEALANSPWNHLFFKPRRVSCGRLISRPCPCMECSDLREKTMAAL